RRDRMDRSLVSTRPLTGRKVLFMLVAFFGVVIGVNMIMMKLAIQTLPGTEVDSAYSASLAYESEIAAAHDQNARNWSVDARIGRDSAGGATGPSPWRKWEAESIAAIWPRSRPDNGTLCLKETRPADGCFCPGIAF